jgi:hypothetical protein
VDKRLKTAHPSERDNAATVRNLEALALIFEIGVSRLWACRRLSFPTINS